MIRVIRRCPTAALFFALILGSSDGILAQTPTPRAPVPAKADQAESLKLVRDVFADEWATAKSPEQKSELAEKILQQAIAGRKGSADQYVLLRVARDLAVLAGDTDTVSSAIEQSAALFKVERASLYVVAGQKLQKRVGTSEQRKALGAVIATWADIALGDDNFAAAGELIDAALVITRKARDTDAARSLILRRKEVVAMKAALEKLRDTPNDAAAKLTAGRFYCFVTKDWGKGIAFLAASGNSELGRLARKESVAKKSKRDMLALADGWWALAEKEEGDAKSALMARAGLWYKQALPEHEGLARVRIEKRLAQIAKAIFGKGPGAVTDDVEKKAEDLRHELRFSGDGQYLRTGLVWDGRPFTVEVIATPAAIAKGKDQSIVADSEGSGFGLMINRAGFFEFRVMQNGQTSYVQPRSIAGAFSRKEVHLAGVFDGRRVGLFVNGVLQTAKNFSTARGPRLSKRHVLIGADPDKTAHSGTNFFNGTLESVMITSGVKYRKNFKPSHDLSQGVKKNAVVLHLDCRTGKENGLKDKSKRPIKVVAVGQPTFVEVETEKPEGDE